MARYYEDAWPAYVPVAERRRQAELAAAKLAKTGSALAPVALAGNKIASTFWGKAWCENLESYRDYENRLPRGRSYVRNGLVIDLQVAPHVVTALVSGSSVYRIKIDISLLPKAQWKSICDDCTGGIDSLVELLQGRFSKGVMERICRQGTGLFPKPSEIKLSCSCPDGASMCKHVAAALYGLGARLDEKPELLFRLRGVNESDLVANIGSGVPLGGKAPARNVLEGDDMAALFGLDMAEPVLTRSSTAVVAPKAAAKPTPVGKLEPAVKVKPLGKVKPVEPAKPAAAAAEPAAKPRAAAKKALPPWPICVPEPKTTHADAGSPRPKAIPKTAAVLTEVPVTTPSAKAKNTGKKALPPWPIAVPETSPIVGPEPVDASAEVLAVASKPKTRSKLALVAATPVAATREPKPAIAARKAKILATTGAGRKKSDRK